MKKECYTIMRINVVSEERAMRSAPLTIRKAHKPAQVVHAQVRHPKMSYKERLIYGIPTSIFRRYDETGNTMQRMAVCHQMLRGATSHMEEVHNLCYS